MYFIPVSMVFFLPSKHMGQSDHSPGGFNPLYSLQSIQTVPPPPHPRSPKDKAAFYPIRGVPVDISEWKSQNLPEWKENITLLQTSSHRLKHIGRFSPNGSMSGVGSIFKDLWNPLEMLSISESETLGWIPRRVLSHGWKTGATFFYSVSDSPSRGCLSAPS